MNYEKSRIDDIKKKLERPDKLTAINLKSLLCELDYLEKIVDKR